MITEDYVSLEVAKLLKEKGFDIPYNSRGVYINGVLLNPGDGYRFNYEDEIINVCSLQMAMKWLREVHNLHIAVIVAYRHLPRRYEAHIMKLKSIDDFILNQLVDFASYEEACESAIRYCLTELI